MATGDTPEGGRTGSVDGYDRDVERIDAEPWIDDVSIGPAPAPGDSPVPATPDDRAASKRRAPGAQDALPDEPAFRELGPREPSGGAGMEQRMLALAEARHLDVDAPTETRPGHVFAVHAQITVAPRGVASAILQPFDLPAAGRRVTLDLTASANLVPRGPTTAQVLVRRGEDAGIVRFELEGIREGKASLDVRAFADQQFVGAVHVGLVVHGDADARQQRVTSAATLAGSDPGGLTLEIRLDAERRFYEFQLRGAGFVERPVRADAGALDATARGLQQQLDDLARGTPPYSAQALQAILRGQGAAIWKLLPPAVQATLADNVGRAERLGILTEGDPTPWELVFASREGTRGFLSDLFLVTRWQYGAGAPLDIGRGHRCYVSPPAQPPGAPSAAAAEIASVERHLGRGVAISTVDGVLDEIDARGFGLMHFAAHNVPNFTRPNASAIQLDQPFIQAMVGDDRAGTLRERQPLIFVNACSSATPTGLWAGAEDWAGRFLGAGAGAFIGTLWAIRDGSAAAFASEFYRHVSERAPVGVAFARARSVIRAEGDPTWLAYTLYANPHACFHGVDS